MSFIGIDLDTTSIFDLLLTYFNAKKMFQDATITTEISSSNRGFHIIIKTKKEINKFDNFLIRAVLGDCSERLKLSLEKAFLNPKEKYNDLIFTKKGNNNVKIFNLENILNNYRKDVNFINKHWGDNLALERIEKLSKKVGRKIKTKNLWLTCFAFSTDSLRVKLSKVCSDIYVNDPSFKYKIYQNYNPDTEYLLIIFSETKNKAFQRGEWFLKNVFDENDIKKIKRFGRKKYYWVKKKVDK
ncbi:MAG: hypothetical protein ACE5KE_00610 [Methanosarcinales archaeon]